MQHFLLIFDHDKQELRETRVFSDAESEAATAAYQEAEEAYGSDSSIEIVLIGADSQATVERTHGHYFGRGNLRLRYLRAV